MYMKSGNMWPFATGFFHLAYVFKVRLILVCVNTIFLLPRNIHGRDKLHVFYPFTSGWPLVMFIQQYVNIHVLKIQCASSVVIICSKQHRVFSQPYLLLFGW